MVEPFCRFRHFDSIILSHICFCRSVFVTRPAANMAENVTVTYSFAPRICEVWSFVLTLPMASMMIPSSSIT